jgi:hypothetical protein
MTMEQAIEEAGLVGGDDGLHPNLPAETAIEVAPMLGFIAKASQSNIGEPTSFLGQVRFRPGVFCYDPIRFVSKMSSTPCGANVPVFELAVRKFKATADLYPNVPLVGTISKAVLRIIKSKRGHIDTDVKYDDICRPMDNYQISTWKYEAKLNGKRFSGLPFEIDYDEACGLIANRMGLPLVTLATILKAYDDASDFGDFPSHMIDNKGERKAFKYPTIFQGNLYRPKAPTSGGSDKKSSSELITKDQEPIASRAIKDAKKSKKSISNKSSRQKEARRKRSSASESPKSPAGSTSTTVSNDSKTSGTERASSEK